MTLDEALTKLEDAVRDSLAWDPDPAGITNARAAVLAVAGAAGPAHACATCGWVHGDLDAMLEAAPRCAECGRSEEGECYRLRDEVWATIARPDEVLHPWCAAKRLRRPLAPSDLPDGAHPSPILAWAVREIDLAATGKATALDLAARANAAVVEERQRAAGLAADLAAVIVQRDAALADLERVRTCNRAHERVNRALGARLASMGHPDASP